MNKKNFALNKHTWFVGLVFGLLLVLALITNIQSVNADNGYVVDPANYLNKNTEEYIERLNEQDLTGLTDRPQYMVTARAAVGKRSLMVAVTESLTASSTNRLILLISSSTVGKSETSFSL